jgi:hypothetical protein
MVVGRHSNTATRLACPAAKNAMFLLVDGQANKTGINCLFPVAVAG